MGITDEELDYILSVETALSYLEALDENPHEQIEDRVEEARQKLQEIVNLYDDKGVLVNGKLEYLGEKAA